MFSSRLGAVAAFAGGLAILALAPVAASANAIGFGGTWTEADDGQNPALNTVSFDTLVTFVADGIFTGYTASAVKDLELEATATSDDGVTAFTDYAINTSIFDGIAWKTYEDAAGNIITFDLDLDATWLRTFDIVDSDVNYEQAANSLGIFEYTGRYNLPDGSSLVGRGSMNASTTGTAQSYEITQAAVPIPAAAWLLAGAIGALGIARKRKAAA